MWDEKFETVLRASLPLATTLEPDTKLHDVGLDSMKMMTILADLEEAYGGVLPDDESTFEAFATPADLWALVHRVLVSRPGER